MKFSYSVLFVNYISVNVLHLRKINYKKLLAKNWLCHAKGLKLVRYETHGCTSLKQRTVQCGHVGNSAPTVHAFYHKTFYPEFNIWYIYTFHNLISVNLSAYKS